MKASDLCKGIEILEKYDPMGIVVSFQPDEIYAGSLKDPDPTAFEKISEADKTELGKQGWTWEPIYTCWSHFT